MVNQVKNNIPAEPKFVAAQPTASSRGKGKASGYKKSLVEKQELKKLYGLSEKQLSRYVRESLAKIQRIDNVAEEFVKRLEKRLDNVVFRAGFAQTRKHARQLVCHGYFLVNGKSNNIPSMEVDKNDVVAIKENKKKKAVFSALSDFLKKTEPPSWMKVNKEKLEAVVVGDPGQREANLPIEISLVFEFYSR